MKRNIVIIIISWFFIVLFLYSGFSKLIDYREFKADLSGNPMLPSWSGWIAWIIPVAEILIPVALFRSVWRVTGLYLSCIIMVLFTIYLICSNNLVSCGCGRLIEKLTIRQHLVFNTACIVLSLFGILQAYMPIRTLSFRSISLSATLLLFFIIGWAVISSFLVPANERTGREGQPIPAFSILLADSTTRLNMADIPAGKRIVIVGISPYCPHCQGEIADILSHIEYFKNTQIYFVTGFPYKDLKILYNDFQLNRYSNITAGIDRSNAFIAYYKASVIPYTAIYDSQKRLIRALPGRAEINSLIRYATE